VANMSHQELHSNIEIPELHDYFTNCIIQTGILKELEVCDFDKTCSAYHSENIT